MMGRLFSVILSLSISGGLVGLLILLLRPLTDRFFAKRWTYYLWFLVIARLLLPIHADVNLMEYLSVRLAAVESGLTSADGAAKAAEEADRESTVSDIVQNGYNGTVGQIESAGGTESNDAGMAEATADATETEEMAGQDTGQTGDIETVQNTAVGGKVESAYSGIDTDNDIGSGRRGLWLDMAGILWLFGVLIAAFRKIYIYQRFAGAVRAASAPVTDDRVYRKSAEIQMRLGLGKRVPLYKSTVIDSPMLVGILKPCIYMPSVLLAEMEGKENDICLILHHELVHYKRKDIWYKWLFQAALCVHWFNPLLYVFNRKFNMDCELACDEKVMALLSEEGRRAYGNVLLDVAQKNLCEENIFEKNWMMHKNVPTMTLLEEKHTLKERLRGIAHYHKNGIVVGLCSAVALVMFLAVAVVCGAAGVSADGGNNFSAHNEGDFAARFWGQISDSSFDWGEPMWINTKGKAYDIYDDETLIAGDSENDVWRAYNYCGGDGSVKVSKFSFNGSDTLWILYANRETTMEISSEFYLLDGRFKVVYVGPDQTVQTLNESGEKNTVKITLPEGRNVIKMVGQKARLEDVNIAYSGVRKEDLDGIYDSEAVEYAYQALEGKRPLDPESLEEVCPYLKEGEVSELTRKAWKDEVALSEDNWQELFIYSDSGATAQYLLEELQAGRCGDFDGSILVKIAPYMKEKDVSECFRYLLERNAVAAPDWQEIFVYSDANLSAGYLAKALREGSAVGFDEKALGQICYYVSTKPLTDIVTAMGKDTLSFDGLMQYVLPYLQKQDEVVTCICYYIDLENTLTDEELRKVQGYVSEEGFYRVVEYNGKRK